jgi:hypothetical protein
VKALQVFAGPRARVQLLERGLSAADVRVIPAAAGGAKGLALLPLDRFIFGRWLQQSTQRVHLLGASIGAWRMAAACMDRPEQAIATLGQDYITQTYPHAPGRMPTPQVITEIFARRLDERLAARASEVLNHPRFRLHVFTSRGKGPLHRPGRIGMPLGWTGAFAANAMHRSALGKLVERVVFDDPRDPLPLPLIDFPTRRVALDSGNLARAVLASCTIPFALQAVQDIPGAPEGSYWDGGITDYHLHLDYASMTDGLVLYPHFISQVIPGWLDKAWKRRHRSSDMLANLVLLAPHPEWIRTLPRGRLPSRQDFKDYGEDEAGRHRDWFRALHESQRLADEFEQLVTAGRSIDALPLA